MVAEAVGRHPCRGSNQGVRGTATDRDRAATSDRRPRRRSDVERARVVIRRLIVRGGRTDRSAPLVDSHLRARSAHRVAHPSAGTDDHHHLRARPRSARRRADRGGAARRHRLLRAWRETLARCGARQRHCRDEGRQGGRLDGEGVGRRLPRECGMMADEQTRAQKAYADVAPDFADLSDRVLFGEVWERPGLSAAGASPARRSGASPKRSRCSASVRRRTSCPDVEMIAMADINQAYQRMERSDVRYRFVIDMASLPLGNAWKRSDPEYDQAQRPPQRSRNNASGRT